MSMGLDALISKPGLIIFYLSISQAVPQETQVSSHSLIDISSKRALRPDNEGTWRFRESFGKETCLTLIHSKFLWHLTVGIFFTFFFLSNSSFTSMNITWDTRVPWNHETWFSVLAPWSGPQGFQRTFYLKTLPLSEMRVTNADHCILSKRHYGFWLCRLAFGTLLLATRWVSSALNVHAPLFECRLGLASVNTNSLVYIGF